jgi:hypothetical protein
MQDERVVAIDINLTRGLVILLALALLAAAFLGYLAWGRDEAAASGSQIPLAASSGMRQYYVTKTYSVGADAADACASGYHMASLWEIMDPSSLKYNTDLGDTRSDSGQGPPSDKQGWVPTTGPAAKFLTTVRGPGCPAAGIQDKTSTSGRWVTKAAG